MARAVRRTRVSLLLLGIAGVTTCVLVAPGVLFNRQFNTAAPRVTPVPAVVGMTKATAVRTLRAAHLRPVIRFTRHAKGQQSEIVVAAEVGHHPISVGGGRSVGALTEGSAVHLIVSR